MPRTRKTITGVPQEIPGRRVVLVTARMLASEAGWHTRPLAELLRKITFEVGDENDVHVILAIPGLQARDLLYRFMLAVNHYTREVGRRSHYKAPTRKIIVRLASAEETSEGAFNVTDSNFVYGNVDSNREMRVTLISAEYMALYRSTVAYVLPGDVWEILLSRLQHDPVNDVTLWPSANWDTEAALEDWANHPRGSRIVSVTSISPGRALSDFPDVRTYINGDLKKELGRTTG